MVKVSVVVPCLNMSRYIESCLDSIMNQTLKELEILVVDGGSSDGTLDILERYRRENKRVQVLHSEKKSYGYQVNMGIAQASGQYVAIVDADDRVSRNMYETLYETAVRSGADYVKGTARRFYSVSNDFTYYIPLMQFSNLEYSNRAINVIPMERPDLLTKDNFLWYGIFRREFMNDVLLHESPGAAFQDLGGLLQTQMRARKAVYLENVFYEYRQDNEASSFYNSKGFQFTWEEYIWAEQFIVNASERWKAAFYRKLFLHTLSIYYAMAASGRVWKDSEKYICLIREKLQNKLTDKTLKRGDFSENEWEELQLFLKPGNGLYDKYQGQFLCGKSQLANIKKTALGKEIVIFGFGNVGMFVYAQIRKHGLGRVVAFCDNQAEKHGQSYGGVTVLSPEETVKQYPDVCFVIASTSYWEDMKQQLAAMNVPQSRICAYTAGIDIYLFGASVI